MRLGVSGSVAVATCVLVLAGCTTAVTPSSPPAPSFQCTPEAGGDAYDCNRQQYDEMVAKDKLYAEAEVVYRKFLAEDTRIMRAGGVEEPTEVLLETTSGEFLEDVMGTYSALEDNGVVARGEDPTIGQFVRVPGRSKTGSIVSITTCVDGTSLEFFDGERSLGKGLVALDDNYFGIVDGHLKLLGADGKEVTGC